MPSTMRKSKRLLISSLITLASIPLIAWILGELVLYYELITTGAASREELGDDFGLGILLFLVVPAGTLLSACLVWIAAWWGTGKPEANPNSTTVPRET